METEKEQQKHRCKICNKSFSSGRSLGGHMRSHIHSSHSDAEEKEKLEGSRGQVGLGFGYGLRENPKKTFKSSDFAGEDLAPSSKLCKECGKEFPSWKSLFGHMRWHSVKLNYPRSFEEEEEGSWIEEKDSSESFSDENEQTRFPIPVVPRRKRRSKRASPASITGYEPEQEDVAVILMMLSRDISEFSDKISEQDSGDELRKRKIMNPTVLGKKRAMLGDNGYPFNELNVLGSRYKCLTCKKVFQSYHALGGHRASHKRIRNCCRENPSFDIEASVENLGVVGQKSRIHECNICGKVFSSGQALGGHKRSHLISNIGGREGGGDHQRIVVEHFSEPLDLNLPAPVVEGSSNLKAWWAELSRKHEQH
ncbi:zinc finger protein ZAT9 [Dendrobium catenatum]|uniref:zinc finger protein ZAT9 n=1 Tax=Dendrobium catenatum TaxID=906689 RepID=UPI0009F60D86|nr:zinc finger protein ZAT9 [Dendrobium catenatum]